MKDITTLYHGSMAALPTPYRLGRVDLPSLEGLCRSEERRVGKEC